LNNLFTKHLKEGTIERINIYDNWGNRYPLNNSIIFETIDQARQWLKENFESYIIKWHRELSKDFKRKITYPDYYIIKKEVITTTIINLKPHEF